MYITSEAQIDSLFVSKKLIKHPEAYMNLVLSALLSQQAMDYQNICKTICFRVPYKAKHVHTIQSIQKILSSLNHQNININDDEYIQKIQEIYDLMQMIGYQDIKMKIIKNRDNRYCCETKNEFIYFYLPYQFNVLLTLGRSNDIITTDSILSHYSRKIADMVISPFLFEHNIIIQPMLYNNKHIKKYQYNKNHHYQQETQNTGSLIYIYDEHLDDFITCLAVDHHMSCFKSINIITSAIKPNINNEQQ